jgi:hypothetical protein
MSGAMKRTTLIPSLLISILFVFLSSSVVAAPLADGSAAFDLSLAPGSSIQFEHLTIEDGLSQNAGLAIFQDSQAFLWVGSQDELNRYDDYTSKSSGTIRKISIRLVTTASSPLQRTTKAIYGMATRAARTIRSKP